MEYIFLCKCGSRARNPIQVKTLLYYHGGLSTATSYYRGIGQLSPIRKRMGHYFQIVPENAVEHNNIIQADAIFMERPYTKGALDVVIQAHMEGIPVWVDYDDNLFDLPRSNPCYDTYSNKKTRGTIESIIEIADYVTFSTEYLRNAMGNGRKGIVIKNELAKPQSYISKIKKNKITDKFVFWRGSNTHLEDISHYVDAIIGASNGHPDWQFEFMGADPWPITTKLEGRESFTPGLSLGEYFMFMASKVIPIAIVPLEKRPFNESKSNIAALEATWLSGAHVLVPDMPEWASLNIPCWHIYKDNESFQKKLDELMGCIDRNNGQMSDEMIQEVNESRKMLIQIYGDPDPSKQPTVAQKQRMDVLESML